MIPLSQGHFKVLDVCDRKYQYIFLDALSGPSTYEQQVSTQWGSQFHLLMQQRALDLPVEVMTTANAEMASSLAALAEAAPNVFEHLPARPSELENATESPPLSQTFSQSEQRRQLVFDDYLLTVIYDLVVQTPESGQVFDWKTHQNPPRQEWLQHDWQTRLYLYVLCETTALKPQQLSMTYWFVRPGATEAKPSFYQFGYSQRQHRQTQRDLQQLTHRLTELRSLAERGINFPKVSAEKGQCDRCLFNVRCDRAAPLSENRVPSTAGATSQSHIGHTAADTVQPPDPYQLLQTASQVSIDTVEEIPLE